MYVASWGSFSEQVSVRSFTTDNLTIKCSSYSRCCIGVPLVIVWPANCFILLSGTHTQAGTQSDPGVSVRLAVTVWIVKERERKDCSYSLCCSGCLVVVCGPGAVMVSPRDDPYPFTRTYLQK